MFIGLIKTLRPKHWIKNGFLFVGLIFDRQLTNLDAFVDTLIGFGLFSLLAGAIYIINDLSDIEADRQHPKKRKRPIAAGELPVNVSRAAVIIIALVVFPLAYLLSPAFAVIGGVYFFVNLAYSTWLKHITLVDVLVLASFYVMRVAAGISLIEVQRFSPWLYVFTIFLALYLGIGKRRAELVLLADKANDHRKVLGGYNLAFLDQLITIVLTLTILTYSLYTFFAPDLPANHAMMLTIPFVIYGIFRYLYLVQVEQRGDAPEELLLTDRPLQISIILWGVAVLIIFYAFQV